MLENSEVPGLIPMPLSQIKMTKQMLFLLCNFFGSISGSVCDSRISDSGAASILCHNPGQFGGEKEIKAAKDK